ncbi:MAG: serine hydrolase domain-containing protein [Fuerstiella sp.]
MKYLAIALFGCCLVPQLELAANEDVTGESHHDSLSVAPPEAVGMNSRRLNVIDQIVAEGLSRGKMPGCVVLVGYRGHTVFHKAYGHRQLKPEKAVMLPDTVFDLASLTKPIATATSVMSLIEQGKLSLDDPVGQHIPEFATNGKEGISIRQLLTHMGGLIPDNSLRDYNDGPAEAMRRVFALKPTAVPGEKFMYSDVGFIVLAELVKRMTGEDVHEYSRRVIFSPLHMTETGFIPGAKLAARAAVTEQRDGHWMQGEVHDPRSFALGGIAGHAGLFSTAKDLARYAQAMINGGILDGVRVLKPETVALMRSPVQVSSGLRTPGWDMRSPYSSNRGDLLSASAFGHGGFTGTALWIDPEQQLFVVFLSNRVHPDGKGSVNLLAGRICTVAAAAVGHATAK